MRNNSGKLRARHIKARHGRMLAVIFMDIVYSGHAKKWLKQRGIAEFEVEHILRFQQCVRHSSEGLKEAVGNSNNREIRIVFARKENYIKVVTVL